MLSLKKARLTNASTSAKIVRNAYRTYFNSNGKVSFQENMIS
jgi:hypothetical protein